MRLIDADALLKHEIEADHMGAMLVVGKGYILSAPEVDAAPVVHGEWIKKSSEETETLALCSKCSYPISWWHKTNFCPNCGADMRGSEVKE